MLQAILAQVGDSIGRGRDTPHQGAGFGIDDIEAAPHGIGRGDAGGVLGGVVAGAEYQHGLGLAVHVFIAGNPGHHRGRPALAHLSEASRAGINLPQKAGCARNRDVQSIQHAAAAAHAEVDIGLVAVSGIDGAVQADIPGVEHRRAIYSVDVVGRQAVLRPLFQYRRQFLGEKRPVLLAVIIAEHMEETGIGAHHDSKVGVSDRKRAEGAIVHHQRLAVQHIRQDPGPCAEPGAGGIHLVTPAPVNQGIELNLVGHTKEIEQRAGGITGIGNVITIGLGVKIGRGKVLQRAIGAGIGLDHTHGGAA